MLATEALNGETDLLPAEFRSFCIIPTFYNYARDTDYMLEGIIELAEEVEVFVGPRTSGESIVAAWAAHTFHIPLISPSATTPSLSSRGTFSYFFRSTASDSFQSQAIADLVNLLQVRELGVLYVNEAYGEGGLHVLSEQLGANVSIFAESHERRGDDENATENALRAQLLDLRARETVRMFILITYDLEMVSFLRVIRELHMLEGYLWVATDGALGVGDILMDEGETELAEVALPGLLIVAPEDGMGSVHEYIEGSWRSFTNASVSGEAACGVLNFDGGDSVPDPWADAVFDAFLVAALAANRSAVQPPTGLSIREALAAPLGAVLPSASFGDVDAQFLGEDGGFLPRYTIQNSGNDGSLQIVGTWNPTSRLRMNFSSIVWSGESPRARAVMPTVRVTYLTTFARQSSASLEIDFYRQAFAGMARSAAFYPNSDAYVTPDAEKSTSASELINEVLRFSSRGSDLVCFVGFDPAYEATSLQMGLSFPQTTFAIIDSTIRAENTGIGVAAPSNVWSVVFIEEDTSFLAGVLAGMFVKERNLPKSVGGVFGPTNVAAIRRLAYGFKAGVEYVCGGCKVTLLHLPKQLGSYVPWIDTEGGVELAMELVSKHKAQVIFGAASDAGSAAIQYVAARNLSWVIGVDVDEYVTTFGNGSVPGSHRILTSVTKSLDMAALIPTSVAFAADSHVSSADILSVAASTADFSAHDPSTTTTLLGSSITLPQLRNLTLNPTTGSVLPTPGDPYIEQTAFLTLSNSGMGLSVCHESCHLFGEDTMETVARVQDRILSGNLHVQVVWDNGDPFPTPESCGVGANFAPNTRQYPDDFELALATALCIPCPSTTNTRNAGEECEGCSDGAVCEGEGHMAATQGYWQSRQDSWEFYDCEVFRFACCPHGNCTAGADAPCAMGRRGVLCAECDEGYSSMGPTAPCVPCEAADAAALSILGLLGLAGLLVAIFSVANARAAVVSVMVDTIQLAALLVPPGRKLGFGAQPAFAIDWGVVNLELSFWADSCVLPLSPLGRFLSQPLTLAVLLFLLLLLYLCFRIAAVFLDGLLRRESWRFEQALLILLFIGYMALTRIGFEVLVCREVDSELVVRSYPAVACSGTTYTILLAIFPPLATILFIILPPAIIIFNARNLRSFGVDATVPFITGRCDEFFFGRIPKSRDLARFSLASSFVQELHSPKKRFQSKPSIPIRRIRSDPQDSRLYQDSSAPPPGSDSSLGGSRVSSAASMFPTKPETCGEIVPKEVIAAPPPPPFPQIPPSRRGKRSAAAIAPSDGASHPSSPSAAANPERWKVVKQKTMEVKALEGIMGHGKRLARAELGLLDVPLRVRGSAKLWLPFRHDIRPWGYAFFLFRRALAAILYVSLSGDLALRRVVLAMFIIFLLVAQVKLQLFARQRDNLLASFCTAMLSVIAAIEAALGDAAADIPSLRRILTLALLCSILAIFLTFLSDRFPTIRHYMGYFSSSEESEEEEGDGEELEVLG